MIWKFTWTNSTCKHCRGIAMNRPVAGRLNRTLTFPNNSANVEHTSVSLKPSAFEIEIGVVILAFWG